MYPRTFRLIERSPVFNLFFILHRIPTWEHFVIAVADVINAFVEAIKRRLGLGYIAGIIKFSGLLGLLGLYIICANRIPYKDARVERDVRDAALFHYSSFNETKSVIFWF